MPSGYTIEDIEIGKEYGFWVFITVNSDHFTEMDIVMGKCIKKGKKKVAIQIRPDLIKWKYPNELT